MDIPPQETRIRRAIESYQQGRYPSLTAAAKALEVPPSTVRHRAAGRKPADETTTSRLALDVKEEKALLDWVFQLHRLGVPARPSRLREMSEHIRQKLPPLGKNWVSRFIKRHPEIKTVMSAKIDKQRWDCVSKASCEKWFGNFETAVREYQILDSNIYNMDEKGCILGLSERAKVLIPSDSDVSYKQQPGNRESVTIIESVNGAGDVIPPFVIWSAKEHRNNWIPLSLDKSMDGTVFAISPNGYTDHELSFEWISKVFHPATVQRCRGHTRLLVMDGHSSHLTGELLGFCHDNNILPICLPSHTSHMLQPLDVGCFGPLAHYYRIEVEEACINGLDNVSKVDFIRFYAEARQRAFTRENIYSSFSESGLVPFNPSAVYEKLISEDKRPQTPESSSRPSSSGQLKTPGDFAGLLSYCRRLEKCIEEHGIEDSPTRKLSKKVSGGVLRQGAEFAILQKENTGLKKEMKAKKEKNSQKRKKINCSGRVVTLAQVHQIREEEKKREAEKEEATDRRKIRLEEAAKKKAEKAEEAAKKKAEKAEKAEEAAKKKAEKAEEVRKKAENAQREKTSDVEDLTLSFLTLDISGSEDDTPPPPRRRAPPTCSLCGIQGHTCRTCPNKSK
jgi:DDE superfamily endonuclease/Tc5 transposase-like DNA-binding protein